MIRNNVLHLGRFIQLNEKYGEKLWNCDRKQGVVFFNQIFERDPLSDLERQQFQAEAEDFSEQLKQSKISDLPPFFESRLKRCRQCKRKLEIRSAQRTVTLYSREGTQTGYHKVKYCRNCKISEHCGYYVKDYYRYLDYKEYNESRYLLSTESTAFEKELLREYKWELVIGKVSFLTKSTIYNQVNKERTNLERNALDRRRLEEGFLLFAVCEVAAMYNIKIDHSIDDIFDLIQYITPFFYNAFIKRWSGHRCKEPGCGNVIVVDGNMKNSRQVCSVKDVTSFIFETWAEEITTGCLNSPAKASRYCKQHKPVSIKFIDEKEIANCNEPSTKKVKQTEERSEEDYAVVKILQTKESQNIIFHEVLWNNKTTSWVRASYLPSMLKQMEGAQTEIIEENTFGQKKKIQLISLTSQSQPDKAPYEAKCEVRSSVCNQNEVTEDEEHNDIESNCNTDKSKQKAKNNKTAGILAITSPCGIVLDIKELYNCESKRQVYGCLSDFLTQHTLIETIVYDDACHLKPFAINKIRKDLTPISKRMAGMDFAVDRFHFKNHIGEWCLENCDPSTFENLNEVNTESCEQLFSWFSSFSFMTKHMKRETFLFLTLYLMESHNQLSSEKAEKTAKRT